jgi:hypothetical protein
MINVSQRITMTPGSLISYHFVPLVITCIHIYYCYELVHLHGEI